MRVATALRAAARTAGGAVAVGAAGPARERAEGARWGNICFTGAGRRCAKSGRGAGRLRTREQLTRGIRTLVNSPRVMKIQYPLKSRVRRRAIYSSSAPPHSLALLRFPRAFFSPPGRAGALRLALPARACAPSCFGSADRRRSYAMPTALSSIHNYTCHRCA